VGLEPERRRQLHAMKLRSLVGEHLAASVEDVVGTDDGASAQLSDGSVAVLAEERAHRGLGNALALSVRSPSDDIYLFAAQEGPVLARRAKLFEGSIEIFDVGKDSVLQAVPARPLTPIKAVSAPELIEVLKQAGLEVVQEHGVTVGEVAGLEVARIVSDDVGTRIEVGVGAHDREAFGLLHGAVPTPQAIEQVASVVRSHRLPGAEPHPLNRLGAERWLRAHLIAQPEKVGLSELVAVAPPIQRTNLKEAVPAVAMGRSPLGEVVVVCAVGIDLDLVPFAADARLLHSADADLMVVVPERDEHQILRDLAQRLVDSAEVVAVEDGWREWTRLSSVP
tara:strand:+ start:14966 stop:15976 length:1011 start_codon:yes stop_codon:yes gene_type:complete